jgi:hypothetical protein
MEPFASPDRLTDDGLEYASSASMTDAEVLGRKDEKGIAWYSGNNNGGYDELHRY